MKNRFDVLGSLEDTVNTGVPHSVTRGAGNQPELQRRGRSRDAGATSLCCSSAAMAYKGVMLSLAIRACCDGWRLRL